MFTTLATFDTGFPADSVEWCPIEGFQDHFVCGTYQLYPEEQQSENTLRHKYQRREGMIFLFQAIPPGILKLHHQTDVPAVLDMKWAHIKCQGKILLGVVNSLGYLQIWEFLADERKIQLLTEIKVRQVEDEVLALSLDWSTGNRLNNEVANIKITVSDSKGYVYLFCLDQNILSLVISREIHCFEAWIAAFNYWDTNIIYSGGDDCKLHRLDTRLGLQSTGCNRVHGAGVTSLHSNASQEYCLASGSYDEILRLWDTRNFRRPISETNLNGGIWRLKWDPFHCRLLLAACMYGGFRLVNGEKTENPEVLQEFNEHKSIAYGCDWSYLSCDKLQSYQAGSKKASLVATCSFYDHTLKLSSLESEIL